MSNQILFIVILFAFIVFTWLLGINLGYNLGVKETEKRWNDAALKKLEVDYEAFCKTRAYKEATAAANFKIKQIVKEMSKRISKSYEETLDKEKENG